jgi:hypothetical protein
MIAYSKTTLVVLEEVCALVCVSITSKIFCGHVSRDTLIQEPKPYSQNTTLGSMNRISWRLLALLGCQAKDLYSLAWLHSAANEADIVLQTDTMRDNRIDFVGVT